MTSGPGSGDPRTSPDYAEERDVRPIVKRPRAGASGLAIAAGAIVAALLLFMVLDSRRRSLQAPATFPRGRITSESAAPPPLYIPPDLSRPAPSAAIPAPAPLPAPPPPQVTTPQPSPQLVYVPQPPPSMAPPVAPPQISSGPALVVDNGAPRQVPGATDDAARTPAPANASGTNTNRARAAMFANRATTVPQGTIIPAVLETGFDSSHAGFARALVQRDIRGFDGNQVLIPRGSRLIGEYSGTVAQGQKRALIVWSRLIRPDGVTISIGSPATDPVGRGGVRARVNSHFLERFAGAILQSVLDVGVNLAAQSSNSPVIVALPGSVQGTNSAAAQPSQIPPTLKVKPGTSISIFVARDLDFTDAEERE